MREITGVQRDDSASRGTNISEYARLIWRKKWFLIVPLLISAIVASIGVRFLVPVYQSSATVRITTEGIANRDLERLTQVETRRMRDSETLLRLETELASAQFLDELVRELGMNRDPDIIRVAQRSRERYPDIPTEELVMRRLRNMLRKRIEVERSGPGLFQLAYLDPDPNAAFVIADAMTNLYVNMQDQARMRDVREVSDFSDEQAAVYKEQLKRSEKALEDFQQRMAQNRLSNNPVHAGNVALAENLRRQLRLRISDSRSTLGRIERNLRSLMGSVPSSSAIRQDTETRTHIADLTAYRVSQLLSSLQGGAEAPGGTDVNDEFLETQGELQRRLADLVMREFPDIAPDYRPLVSEYLYQQANLDSQEAALNELTKDIDGYRRQVELEPQQQAELQRLQQQVTADRDLYNSFVRTKTTTQITEAAQNAELGASTDIVEAASKPLAPVRPDKTQILILALVFGLTIGGGGLLFTEITDTSFKYVEDVERRLELRVVGTIPKIEQNGKWAPDGKGKRTALWIVTSVVLTAAALSSFYFYGKSSKADLMTVKVTRSTSSGVGDY